MGKENYSICDAAGRVESSEITGSRDSNIAKKPDIRSYDRINHNSVVLWISCLLLTANLKVNDL